MEEINEPMETPQEEKKELKMTMSDEDVLRIVKSDIEQAKEDKESINKKMVEWRDTYNAELTGNEIEGRSKYISKDVKKAIHWYVPNAMKPFMSTDDMVDAIPRTADDIQRAKAQATLLNFQFNNDFPRYDFLYQSLMIMAIEGTIIARTGWEHEEEVEEVPFNNITEPQFQEMAQSGAEFIEVNTSQVEVPMTTPDGMPYMDMANVYSGKLKVTNVITSRPTAEVIKNEDFFISSMATSLDNAEFVAQKIDTTRSELMKQDVSINPNGIYKNVKDIIAKDDSDHSTLASSRDTELDDRGQNDDARSEDKSREKITIYEYYGNVDVNGDGIAEPIVCVYSGNTILRLAENPFPDKKAPFIGCPYSAKPFSFWGDAMAAFADDTQKVKTAIMRTFIDLMANSTNGMKHVQKGTIDALNIRKLREAKVGTVVEWNQLGGYQPEQKTDIDGSLLKMFELFSSEIENETGITKYNQGIDAKSLNKTATGISAIMNQSQMRIWETTSRFAEEYIKPLFRKWIAYNQAYLTEEIAVRIAGDEFISISPDDIGGKLDMKINVAIAGSNEQKAQQITAMLQMATPYAQNGIVPPAHLAKLLAQLEDIWGMKDLSSELRQVAEQMGMQPQQPQGQPQPQGVPQ